MDNKHLPKDFSYITITPNNYESYIAIVREALFLTIDIETRKDLSISCIGYCAVMPDLSFKLASIELPYNLPAYEYEYRFTWIANLNATNTPKCGQNFKYDIAYLNRYGCPPVNYLFDTAVCHHSWYAELPKSLDSLAAFYLREFIYWKAEHDSSNLQDLYIYNLLDVYYTSKVFLAWLAEAPGWAVRNYLQEFPVLIPCILAEATGFKASLPKLREIAVKQAGIVEKERAELGASLGVPGFNPGSSKQVKQLLHIIGCKDLAAKSSDEKTLLKAAYRHPYNQWLIDKILAYRKAAKLVSTYLVDSKLFQERVLWTLSPYGTTTGRLASREHSFWCGLQIQNIPRKGGIKEWMIADEGFRIGEADYAQNESRTTGYITGDTVLINAVNSADDFHSFNASKFFGIPYEEICINLPDGSHKILDKEIRQLSKPVNHGKNYNMGDEVLVDTMGLENIFKAARRLGLPSYYSAKQIAAYLGKCFEATYRVVTKDYHEWIKTLTTTMGRLLIGATGWTRYCFGDPTKSKRDLNAYIAHSPQSLAAMILNRVFIRVFWEVWWPNRQDFKLLAQIHDSILFQYREDREDLATKVGQIMEEESEIDVPDIKGVVRRLHVPVDLSIGGLSWQDSKDS